MHSFYFYFGSLATGILLQLFLLLLFAFLHGISGLTSSFHNTSLILTGEMFYDIDI
jgi:hypothetical protein